ncbi:MAG: tetratricopeptide repeat protein [Planctomycetes bacterium]|nr:tetratricopeptide repeat protein [Planctomycetota bacterium]
MRRILPACVLFLAVGLAGFAQDSVGTARLRIIKPTQADKDRREPLYQYVFGVQSMREENYDAALNAFQAAAKLDPAAPAYFRAQVPILAGSGRMADALMACKKALALDSDDFSAWYLLAKLQKALVEYPDAIVSLERGLKTSDIQGHPEVAQMFHIEVATLYEGANKFGPAADHFQKAIAILEDPDRIVQKAHVPREVVLLRAADTYEKVGLLYRKAKQYDEAVEALKTAQQRAPVRAGRLSYTLAQIAEEQGKFKDSLIHLDAYLVTRPLSTDPHEMKIRLMRATNQADAIVPWLEETANRERFNTTLHLLLAKECAFAKQFKKAETVYVKLAEESPSAELYRGLFNVYKDESPDGLTRVLGMLDRVMDKQARADGPAPIGTTLHARAMVAALRSDSELARRLINIATKPRKEPLKLDTIYFLGGLADRQRQYDQAESFYRQCLADKETTAANEAAIHVGLVRVLSGARKHDAVIKTCDTALANVKGVNPLVWHQEKARAQAAFKKYDDALATIDAASKIANDDERFVFQKLRIGILSTAHRFADAETECLALLKSRVRLNDTLSLQYILAGIYSANKQMEKSEQQLKAILQLDPDNPAANNDLGYTWADQKKNLDAAETMIRKALEADRLLRRRNPNLDPEDDHDNAAYVDSLGWVMFRRGRFEEARKELERAALLDRNEDPVIYDHLGDVYERLKMPGEAQRAWRRALELYDAGVRSPDRDRMKELRDKLERTR